MSPNRAARKVPFTVESLMTRRRGVGKSLHVAEGVPEHCLPSRFYGVLHGPSSQNSDMSHVTRV